MANVVPDYWATLGQRLINWVAQMAARVRRRCRYTRAIRPGAGSAPQPAADLAAAISAWPACQRPFRAVRHPTAGGCRRGAGEHKWVRDRVAAIDVAKDTGMVCTRAPHPPRPSSPAGPVKISAVGISSIYAAVAPGSRYSARPARIFSSPSDIR